MKNPTAGRASRDVVSLPIHPSVLSGYGLIEAPFDLALHRFGTHRRADQSQMSIVGTSANPAQALDYLSVRTFPATRLVLVDLGGWTAVLTNGRNGSDFNDHQFWAGRTVGARTVRVVDQDATWWRRGRLRERLAWEGRIFELHAADNSNIRTVTAMNDGGRCVRGDTDLQGPSQSDGGAYRS